MRPNYLGIIGGIFAFVSIALPWWIVSISSSIRGAGISDEASLYLYQARVTIMGTSAIASTNPWYCSTALAFIVLAGLLGLAGSVISTGRKIVLAVGGLLALSSIIIFAAGLQNQISNGSLAPGYPTGAGLFSSGSYSYFGISFNYSSYLSFGFWLAAIATILLFVALTRKPTNSIPQTQPSPPLPP